MYLNLTNFSSEELQFHREALLSIINDFVYSTFNDTEDSVYIGIHDLHNAIVGEIDRRSSAKPLCSAKKEERLDAFNRISKLRRQLERRISDVFCIFALMFECKGKCFLVMLVSEINFKVILFQFEFF